VTTIGLCQINWDLNWDHAESLSDADEPTSYALLPYSVGLLRAYASTHARRADEISWRTPIFSRQPTAVSADHLEGCDLVGFSAYVWNVEASLALARELKRRTPDVVIVFGGPQVPDDPEEFLRANPCVDLATRGEGEATFTAIIDALESRCWHTVHGVSWMEDGEFRSNAPRERSKQLDEYPSPYLTGAFDDLMLAHPEQRWVATWETNRGCPFACTFCDWGSATATRVYSFDMERIQAEIDWFGRHRIGFVLCCDANFGMLPRDLDIAKGIVDSRKRTGFPFSFMIQNAKNATERSYDIQKLINDSMQTIGVTLSIQSADEGTLKNIRRSNIRSESFQELQRRFTRDGVDTYTDIIIGLPGETYDAFVDSVSTTVGFGQHNQIQFHNCSVLPNAEMGSPEYIERFGIRTTPQPLRSLYSRRDDVPEIEEYLDTVVATDAMASEDWARSKAFAWMVELLYFDRVAQIPMLLLQRRHGLSFRAVMEAILVAAEPGSVLASVQDRLLDHATSLVDGSIEYMVHESTGDLLWPADQHALICLVADETFDRCMDEVHTALTTLLETHLDDPDNLGDLDHAEEITILDEAMTLNRELFCLPFQPADKRLMLSHDLLGFWRHAIRGESIDLDLELTRYSITRSKRTWDTLDAWVESLTWNQGPNRRKYLYPVEGGRA